MVLEFYHLSPSKTPPPRCMPSKGPIFRLSIYAVPKFPIYIICKFNRSLFAPHLKRSPALLCVSPNTPLQTQILVTLVPYTLNVSYCYFPVWVYALWNQVHVADLTSPACFSIPLDQIVNPRSPEQYQFQFTVHISTFISFWIVSDIQDEKHEPSPPPPKAIRISWFLLLTKYYSGDEMRNVIGGTCGMHVGEQFYWRNCNERDSWEDLGLDGRTA